MARKRMLWIVERTSPSLGGTEHLVLRWIVLASDPQSAIQRAQTGPHAHGEWTARRYPTDLYELPNITRSPAQVAYWRKAADVVETVRS